MTEIPRNLLAGSGAGPAPTLLHEDPAAGELADRLGGAGQPAYGSAELLDVVRAHPASSLCWALLAEGSLALQTSEGDVAAYAYARTGYHRGLDALRRAGWRGAGPVPWEHQANQGFLRAVWALALAAERIGETEEFQRCAELLRDSSEAGYLELQATSAGLRGEGGDRSR